MARAEAADLLRHIPLFSACSEDECRLLGAHAQDIRLSKGETLFRRDEPCLGLHVLVLGGIKLVMTSRHGLEKVVEIIRPGQSFGDAVLFLEQPYPVSAQAIEDSLVLFLPASVLLNTLDQDVRLARRMLAGMSVRLRTLVRDIESYTLDSASDRVVTYLLEQLGDAGQGTVTLSVNKHLLASRLNLTPETFSRTLQKLSEQCGVTVSGRDIHIPDAAALSQLLQTM